MITAISNSNNVTFNGNSGRIARKAAQEGAHLSEQVADVFQKEAPKGLTPNSSVRFSDDSTSENIKGTLMAAGGTFVGLFLLGSSTGMSGG